VLRAASLLCCLLLAVAAPAADRLDSARRAGAMLGPDCWSQVWWIERGDGTTTHVLVFELAGRLWHYEPGVGTQSLSHHPDRLGRDRADPSPLLRAVHPDLQAAAVAPDDGAPPPAGGRLPEGCFIECVVRWRDWCRDGRAPDEARLLAFYTPTGLGHAVLVYTRLGRTYVFDPDQPEAPLRIPSYLADDGPAVARRLLPQRTSAQGLWTRQLTLAPEPARMLAAASRSGPVPGSGAGDDPAFR
jgi:hypothetical protein